MMAVCELCRQMITTPDTVPQMPLGLAQAEKDKVAFMLLAAAMVTHLGTYHQKEVAGFTPIQSGVDSLLSSQLFSSTDPRFAAEKARLRDGVVKLVQELTGDVQAYLKRVAVPTPPGGGLVQQ